MGLAPLRRLRVGSDGRQATGFCHVCSLGPSPHTRARERAGSVATNGRTRNACCGGRPDRHAQSRCPRASVRRPAAKDRGPGGGGSRERRGGVGEGAHTADSWAGARGEGDRRVDRGGRQGRGGVLVIEGPPGIGKSRLLTEVLALAEKAGARALFGEAFEYQQTVPFFSLFMATLRADPPIGDVEALRRLGGTADLRYWVVHDLADAIHAAAAQTPLLIALEDIHWADNGTLLALRSLATMRPGGAVLWVLTVRTGVGGSAVRETLSALQRRMPHFCDWRR